MFHICIKYYKNIVLLPSCKSFYFTHTLLIKFVFVSAKYILLLSYSQHGYNTLKESFQCVSSKHIKSLCKHFLQSFFLATQTKSFLFVFSWLSLLCIDNFVLFNPIRRIYVDSKKWNTVNRTVYILLLLTLSFYLLCFERNGK